MWALMLAVLVTKSMAALSSYNIQTLPLTNLYHARNTLSWPRRFTQKDPCWRVTLSHTSMPLSPSFASCCASWATVDANTAAHSLTLHTLCSSMTSSLVGVATNASVSTDWRTQWIKSIKRASSQCNLVAVPVSGKQLRSRAMGGFRFFQRFSIDSKYLMSSLNNWNTKRTLWASTSNLAIVFIWHLVHQSYIQCSCCTLWNIFSES